MSSVESTGSVAQQASHDSTVVKVASSRSPRGTGGEKYLASGVRVSLRLWEEEPVGTTAVSERDYETVGYVISGRAELHIEGQLVRLEPGDSYLVPRGARHRYVVSEPFTAVEATSPPAFMHGRDERPSAEGHAPSAVRERFLHRVEASASLPAHVTTATAISAVMDALAERLTAGEAHALLEALPRPLRPLFDRRINHRSRRASARVDRAELVDRVARYLGVTPAHGEVVCAAVFDALRAELPVKLVENVTHQLPRDIQELWLSKAPAGPPPVIRATNGREILDEIERRAVLPPNIGSETAFSAVMSALCDRISGGEARDLLLGLPEQLRPLVEHAVFRRGEPSAVFGRDQLLHRIAGHLGTTTEATEAIARVVFAAVRSVLPEREVRDVQSQLPADIAELWRPGRDGDQVPGPSL